MAGDGPIEEEAFDRASYGRQIGLISEVLMSLAGSEIVDADKMESSLKELEAIYVDIEKIKMKHASRRIEEATEVLESLRLSDRRAFDRVLVQLFKSR